MIYKPFVFVQYSEILSVVERLLFFFIPVMAEYLPSELQHAILGNLMYSCAKGLAFKTMIQESWFKISLKRLDKTLNTSSQETFTFFLIAKWCDYF